MKEKQWQCHSSSVCWWPFSESEAWLGRMDMASEVESERLRILVRSIQVYCKEKEGYSQNLNADCHWLRRLAWDLLLGHVGFVNPVTWILQNIQWICGGSEVPARKIKVFFWEKKKRRQKINSSLPLDHGVQVGVRSL